MNGLVPAESQGSGMLTPLTAGGGSFGDRLRAFTAQPAVKRALHVPDDAFFFQCDNGEGFNYHGNTKALMPFYRHVIENTSLRVLVYNGDTDPGLNSFYAQNWTSALGYVEVVVEGSSRTCVCPEGFTQNEATPPRALRSVRCCSHSSHLLT